MIERLKILPLVSRELAKMKAWNFTEDESCAKRRQNQNNKFDSSGISTRHLLLLQLVQP